MKKQCFLFLLFLLPNVLLLAQFKTDEKAQKPAAQRTPQYRKGFISVDALLQTYNSIVEGSANITPVRKQYVNTALTVGYPFGRHKIELGVATGRDDNSWHYTNTRLNAEADLGLNRPTFNVRLGYRYRIFKINDRLGVDLGVGIDMINLSTKTSEGTYSGGTAKLIIAGDERVLSTRIFGADGKIQANYVLTPHFQLHILAQYRYAPTYLRASNATFYDAVTGIKQDAAIVSSYQNAMLLGVGVQYNLQPLFEKVKKEEVSKAKN